MTATGNLPKEVDVLPMTAPCPEVNALLRHLLPLHRRIRAAKSVGEELHLLAGFEQRVEEDTRASTSRSDWDAAQEIFKKRLSIQADQARQLANKVDDLETEKYELIWERNCLEDEVRDLKRKLQVLRNQFGLVSEKLSEAEADCGVRAMKEQQLEGLVLGLRRRVALEGLKRIPESQVLAQHEVTHIAEGGCSEVYRVTGGDAEPVTVYKKALVS